MNDAPIPTTPTDPAVLQHLTDRFEHVKGIDERAFRLNALTAATQIEARIFRGSGGDDDEAVEAAVLARADRFLAWINADNDPVGDTQEGPPA